MVARVQQLSGQNNWPEQLILPERLPKRSMPAVIRRREAVPCFRYPNCS